MFTFELRQIKGKYYLCNNYRGMCYSTKESHSCVYLKTQKGAAVRISTIARPLIFSPKNIFFCETSLRSGHCSSDIYSETLNLPHPCPQNRVHLFYIRVYIDETVCWFLIIFSPPHCKIFRQRLLKRKLSNAVWHQI